MSNVKNDHIINTVSGGFGGVCAVLAGHGFDTMKVRLQIAPITEANVNMMKLTYTTLKNIIISEGFLGLYKGVQAPLLGALPNYALYFFSYNLAKNSQIGTSTNQELSLFKIFSAGSFAGLCCVPLTVPIERVKVLLQMQNNTKGINAYKGFFDCCVKLYKAKGILGLYKGTFLTLYREVPSCGVSFVVYESLKKSLKTENEELSPLKTIIAGGLAGMTTWSFILPVDTMKSCYQTAPDGRYDSTLSVYNDLTKKNGIKTLYRGLLPILVRAFPTSGACFLGYEIAIYSLKAITG